ncbi:MAG: hypothetical protein HRT67_06025 [Flavobacteriaceae bacterium]|nr:hypothetical protein [Flavobacteriaceae bacterium]
MFNTADNWSLDSMIYVIFQGDYELIKIEKSNDNGTLYYNPVGIPFGGTESLVQLIESFGNTVTYDSWHEGTHKRAEIAWDFEVAKKLVEKEKESSSRMKKNGGNFGNKIRRTITRTAFREVLWTIKPFNTKVV